MKIYKLNSSGILVEQDDAEKGFADVLNFEGLTVTDEGTKITVFNDKHYGAPFVINFYAVAYNVSNTYVYFGGNYSNQAGFVCMHSGKINAMAYMNQYDDTSNGNGYISVRKNETYTEIANMSVSNGAQKEYTISPSGSLTFSAGDWLSCYIESTILHKPIIIIELEWTT